jgi:hypothetical protein
MHNSPLLVWGHVGASEYVHAHGRCSGRAERRGRADDANLTVAGAVVSHNCTVWTRQTLPASRSGAAQTRPRGHGDGERVLSDQYARAQQVSCCRPIAAHTRQTGGTSHSGGCLKPACTMAQRANRTAAARLQSARQESRQDRVRTRMMTVYSTGACAAAPRRKCHKVADPYARGAPWA